MSGDLKVHLPETDIGKILETEFEKMGPENTELGICTIAFSKAEKEAYDKYVKGRVLRMKERNRATKEGNSQ